MYVKIASYPNRILPTEGQIEFGSKHWWSDNQGPLGDATLQDIIAYLGVEAGSYDRTNLIDSPAGYRDEDDDKPFWIIKWVRYTHPGHAPQSHMVISTDAIFIVGDDGKTIDRV